MQIEAIRRIRVQSTSEGVDRTTEQLKGLGVAYGSAASGSRSASAAATEYEMALARQLRQMAIADQTAKQLAAANDNLSKSYQAANDNYQTFAGGLVDKASGVLETASHLKLLAVAAYALSPAIRSMVATGVTGTLSLLGANAGLVSAALGRVVAIAGPAVSFFTRLSVPVLLAVGTFKLLSDTIERGSSLLEKYGGTAGQRAMFGTGVDEGLAKLTRFQDETVSAQQIQYATQLGTRLEDAKRTIGEMFAVQLDLTNAALRLQNVWVVIVETLAKALTLVSQIPQGMAGAANAIGNSSIWNKLNLGWSLPGAIPLNQANARINEANGTGQSDLTAEQALELAKKRLAAGMGGGFVGRFNQSIMDLANPPKIEKPEEIKAVADAWTRYADQIAKANKAREADIRTIGLGVQAQEQMRVQLEGEAILEREGIKVTEERRAKLAELAKQAGDLALKRAEAAARSKADFDLQTVGLGGIEKQIADLNFQLYGPAWKNWMDSGVAANMRIADEMKTLKSAADSFGQSLLSNLLNGQKGLVALAGAAKSFISSMSSATLTRVQNGGSFFGNQNLASAGGGLTMASAGIAGYQSGSPLAGALGGAMAGATFGPAGAVIGGVIGLAGGLLGRSAQAAKAEEQRIAQAKQVWESSIYAAETLTAVLEGRSQGTLKPAYQDAYMKAYDLASKAHLAGDDAAANQLLEASSAYYRRIIAEFRGDFDAMIGAFNAGLGPDAPFEKARRGMNDLSQKLQGFVVDTGYAGLSVEVAQKATQAYALSLLQVRAPLTDVETAVADLHGKAAGLQDVLVKLGMTSDAAAAAIASGVTQALAALTENFTGDLQRQLNAATGKDYVNSLTDVIDKHKQNLAGAAALGNDPALVALVDQVFKAQAQQIVDGTDLIGRSFQDLIATYPVLNGLVTESAKALQAQADAQKRAADQYAVDLNNASGKGYLNQINDAIALRTSNQANGISPADAQKLFALQVQQIIDGTDLIGESFDALIAQFPELAGVAKESASALKAQAEAAQQAAEAAQKAAEAAKQFTNNILELKQGLLTGDLSTLNPFEKLAAAQSQFDRDAAAALAGDQTAQGRIAEDTRTLLTIAKEVHGATEAYAAIFAAVMAMLDRLAKMTPATPMASGGLVTGGTPGVDSVPALLMPGELVLTRAQASQYLSARSGLGVADSSPVSAANDNGIYFADLARSIRQNFADATRVQIAGFNGVIARLERLERAHAEGARQISDAFRNGADRERRPGRKTG